MATRRRRLAAESPNFACDNFGQLANWPPNFDEIRPTRWKPRHSKASHPLKSVEKWFQKRPPGGDTHQKQYSTPHSPSPPMVQIWNRSVKAVCEILSGNERRKQTNKQRNEKSRKARYLAKMVPNGGLSTWI